MAKIVGVKFRGTNKIYYFSPNPKEKYQIGDGVIVETTRGVEYGIIAKSLCEIDDEKLIAPLKPVIRIANEDDLDIVANNEVKRIEAQAFAEQKAKECNLDIKIIDCEYTFDNSKVTFYFTHDGRVDFRELVKELSSKLHTRIELRQIGPRDETKIMGGLGTCGRPCCCSGALAEFKKVSIKMAKMQGLSLNPTKISGLCGRLMCCLAFENDYYSDAYKRMPKIGAVVDSPEGEGTVINVNMLKLEARVRIQRDDILMYRDYNVSQLKFKKTHQRDDNEELDDEIKKLLD